MPATPRTPRTSRTERTPREGRQAAKWTERRAGERARLRRRGATMQGKGSSRDLQMPAPKVRVKAEKPKSSGNASSGNALWGGKVNKTSVLSKEKPAPTATPTASPTATPRAKPATYESLVGKTTPASVKVAAPGKPPGMPADQWNYANKFGKHFGVDPRLLAGIGKWETGWGTQGQGRPGHGERTLGYGAYSASKPVNTWSGAEKQYEGAARTLAKRGVKTIQDVAAGKASWYDPQNPSHWAQGVQSVYRSLGAETKPVATPKPKKAKSVPIGKTKPATYESLTGQTSKMETGFKEVEPKRKLAAPAASAYRKAKKELAKRGIRIWANSAYRSNAEQRSIWNRATGGGSHPPSFAVAPPGHSMHERGLAIDMGTDGDIGTIRAVMSKYGFHQFNTRTDPYHFSYGVVG